MKLTRIAIIAASTAALAVGAGAAVGATSGDDAEQREQAVLDDAARRLDTTPEKLREALGAALDAQLDAAVRDGSLTRAQADEIKRRRQESGSVLGFHGGHDGRGGPGHHGPGGPRGAGRFEDLAEALGISERRLEARLRAGRTVAQIARAEGKTLAEVKEAVRAATRARLDEAVADGGAHAVAGRRHARAPRRPPRAAGKPRRRARASRRTSAARRLREPMRAAPPGATSAPAAAQEAPSHLPACRERGRRCSGHVPDRDPVDRRGRRPRRRAPPRRGAPDARRRGDPGQRRLLRDDRARPRGAAGRAASPDPGARRRPPRAALGST